MRRLIRRAGRTRRPRRGAPGAIFARNYIKGAVHRCPSCLPRRPAARPLCTRKPRGAEPPGACSCQTSPRARSLLRSPRPPPRTEWTRRVPHPVLIGHAVCLVLPRHPTPPSRHPRSRRAPPQRSSASQAAAQRLRLRRLPAAPRRALAGPRSALSGARRGASSTKWRRDAPWSM